METPIYSKIASLLQAIENCKKKNASSKWLEKHTDNLNRILDDLPSGSGFDAGTLLNDKSIPEKLIFDVGFHHMDDNGFYDGWTEHQVIVKPSLVFGFTLRITGRNKRNIKEYIHEAFDYRLRQ